MRLHELTATAFGPFAETVTVDFDELSAGGLFLLTGDTGAGKTSVLDAVCFALYGEVPGDRHAARHLRSDHAAPDVAPEVVLRLSVGERTLRLTRSPAWERPKRRGTGSTRVQAHVVVEELRDHRWTALTNRLDEAGHLVTDLLGMTVRQFTQVALLPQNGFQTFLRASSTERQAVLQRLFRTQRYEAVERWLADRRTELRRTSQACHDRTAAVASRIQEAAGTPLPDGCEPHDLGPVVDDGVLLGWAAAQREQATTQLAVCTDALGTVTDELRRRREQLDRARELTGLRERGTRSAHVLQELESTAAEDRELTAVLTIHRRTEPVMPLVRRAGQAASALEEAEEVAAEASEALGTGQEAGTIDLAWLTAASVRLTEAHAVARAWLPRETELVVAREQTELLVQQVEQLQVVVAATQDELETLAPRRAELDAALDDARRLAATQDADVAHVEAVELALAAAGETERLGVLLGEQRSALSVATQRAQDLRDVQQDLREARISGMAAELAVGLAVGCSCPVCGSAEHPAPATAGAVVSRADEDAARQAHETADFERQALQESVSSAELQLHAALVRSEGHRPAYWQRRRTEARAAVRRSAEALERCVPLEQELVALAATEEGLTSALTTARTDLATRSAELRGSRTRRDGLDRELAALLAGHEVGTVHELVAAQSVELDRVGRAREALAQRDQAVAAHATAVAEAVEAARAAGFGSVREVVVGHLPSARAETAQRQLDERRVARATATRALAEPEVAAALAGPEPDLESSAAELARAQATRDAAHAAHEQALHRDTRLETLVAELETQCAAWEPVRREHALTAGLSALVEGKSADNAWRMRLSAYVLSERLRQVVAAANERLGAVTDERYVLEQVDEKGAGEQRGGLSLRVLDQWSGKRRDPATLSGGETFVVSLALALGLADTVSHEAGGTQLDTLFIDEGFGALDAGTLDGVMDTLDSLRDGGRVVGLVSHVPELRDRVASQLEVRRGRGGSTLAPVHHGAVPGPVVGAH